MADIDVLTVHASNIFPGDRIKRHGAWWYVLSARGAGPDNQSIVSKHVLLGSVDTWLTPNATEVTVEMDW